MAGGPYTPGGLGPGAGAGADAESNATIIGRVASRLFGYNGTTWDRIRAGVTGAQSAATGMVNVLGQAIYLTSKPTLTNSQWNGLQCNVNGALDIDEVNMPASEDNTNGVYATTFKPLAVATYCPTLFYIDSPTGAKGFIKASAGNVFGFHAINNNAAIRYLQFCNTTDGTMSGALSAQFAIPATSAITIGQEALTSAGINFTTGISYGFSTTQGSFVAGTAGNHSLTLAYK